MIHIHFLRYLSHLYIAWLSFRYKSYLYSESDWFGTQQRINKNKYVYLYTNSDGYGEIICKSVTYDCLKKREGKNTQLKEIIKSPKAAGCVWCVFIVTAWVCRRGI